MGQPQPRPRPRPRPTPRPTLKNRALHAISVLDHAPRRGQTLRELNNHSRPAWRRVFLWVRVGALVAAILWGIGGTYAGIRQQQAGLPPDAIDCSYRVDLLQDRVVAQIETSPAAGRGLGDDRISNLLRETQAACSAKDERIAQRLDQIRNHHAVVRSSVDRMEAARQELLAQ